MSLWERPYLLIITNLYCNHKCSYCIQQKSSLDVRLNTKKVDVDALLTFLEKNRIDRTARLMGGESTLHPDFEKLMDGLIKLYGRVVITTNLNGKWYNGNFDEAVRKMKSWGDKVRWNTTLHPKWMDPALFIERIRRLQAEGIYLDQIATTDTEDLTPEVAEKMHKANINWKLQTFTGRNSEGRLVPQTWNDINQKYPQLYNPSKYIENYKEYTEECEDANLTTDFYRPNWVSCTTNKFLIGPDNNIYPCHRHLYVEDKNYVMGSIHDPEMTNFSRKWNSLTKQWTLPCATKCNPCDFDSVKIVKTKKVNEDYREPIASL